MCPVTLRCERSEPRRATARTASLPRPFILRGPLRGRLRMTEQLPGARRRLAGFARTLRDNGFQVGLAETSDALAVLASPPRRRGRRRSSRRCARCSAPPTPTGSASTRSSMRSGRAAICGSGRYCPARHRKAQAPAAEACAKRMCRRKRLAFPTVSNGAAMATATSPPTAAAAAKAPRAPKV